MTIAGVLYFPAMIWFEIQRSSVCSPTGGKRVVTMFPCWIHMGSDHPGVSLMWKLRATREEGAELASGPEE